eukprot:SAG31_NODE_22_length_33849_cov_13.713096_13_plen_166_part_00
MPAHVKTNPPENQSQRSPVQGLALALVQRACVAQLKCIRHIYGDLGSFTTTRCLNAIRGISKQSPPIASIYNSVFLKWTGQRCPVHLPGTPRGLTPMCLRGCPAISPGIFQVPAKWLWKMTPEAPFGAGTLFDRARGRVRARRARRAGRDNGVPSTLSRISDSWP